MRNLLFPRHFAQSRSLTSFGMTAFRVFQQPADLASKHPEKLKALIKAWFEEAKKNLVLPFDDRTALELFAIERPTEEEPREREGQVHSPETEVAWDR